MAPRRPRARLALAAAASLGRAAAAAFVCPDANMASHSYCYCTSGCSINGDTTFPWSPPTFPPASIDLGADTVCASVTLPCLGGDPAYSALLTWLGINGTVAPNTPPFLGCAEGVVATIATAFTGAECSSFATAYNALTNVLNEQQGVPSALACAADNCNGVSNVMMPDDGEGSPPPPAFDLSKRDKTFLLVALICGIAGAGMALLIILSLLLYRCRNGGNAALAQQRPVGTPGRRPGSSVRGPPPPQYRDDDYELGGPPPVPAMNTRRNLLYDQGAGNGGGYPRGGGGGGGGGARGYSAPAGQGYGGGREAYDDGRY